MKNNQAYYREKLASAKGMASDELENTAEDEFHVILDALDLLQKVVDGEYKVIDMCHGHEVDVADPWLSYDDGGEA